MHPLSVLIIVFLIQDYLEKNPEERPSSELCRIYMKRVESIYFKHDRGILKTAIPNLKSDSDSEVNKELGKSNSTCIWQYFPNERS